MRFLQIPDIRDNYKVAISCFVLLFIFSIVKAQNNSCFIQYSFGSKVDTIINIAIDRDIIKLGTDESYLISCSNADTVVNVYLIKYCSVCQVFDSTGDIAYWRGYLAKYTSRFYVFKNIKIPIIFSDFDSYFGVVDIINKEKYPIIIKSGYFFDEFESDVCITTNWHGDKIYEVTYFHRK